MELSAEGKTPEYMALAGIKFKLSLPDLKDNPQLKDELLKGIKAGNMAPYYKEVCTDLGWKFDQKLHDEMAKENVKKMGSFKEDDSETPVWQDRFEFTTHSEEHQQRRMGKKLCCQLNLLYTPL